MVFFLFKYWWLSMPVMAIPACFAVMQAAGLKLGRATCVDCGEKHWMVRTRTEYRCDACVQKRTEAAVEAQRKFTEWSFRPYMSGRPVPDSYEPEPPHSGFSTEHRLPFSDRTEPSSPPLPSQYHIPGK